MTIAVSLKKVGKEERDVSGFILGVSPWILFPIIALVTFVPSGERGQWISLLIITILSASAAPLIVIHSRKK